MLSGPSVARGELSLADLVRTRIALWVDVPRFQHAVSGGPGCGMVFVVQRQATPALPADRRPPSDLSELLRYFVRSPPVPPLLPHTSITPNCAIR